MIATLTSKGQLTVPKAIRDQLRLRPGDKLDFVVQVDGRIEVVPKRSAMTELKGMISPPRTGISLEGMEDAIAEGAIAQICSENDAVPVHTLDRKASKSALFRLVL